MFTSVTFVGLMTSTFSCDSAPTAISPSIAMEVRELFRNLEKEAECALCLHTVKKPKTLPCLHSFCLICLDNLANFARRQLQTAVSCPVCLTPFQIPEGDTFAGLPTAFHLNRLVDVLALEHGGAQTQSCSSCEENTAATCYCFDCHDFFCTACVKVHSRMKMSRGHRSVGIDNLQAQDIEELIQRPVMCAEKYHDKEPLEYYCQQCKVCICHKCGFVNHDRHEKVDIQQAAEEHKLQMVDALEKAKKEFAGWEKDFNRRTEFLEKRREEIIAAQNKVRTTMEEIIGVLREHETTMINKLSDILDAQRRDHATQRLNFDLFAAKLRSTLEYGDAIMQRSIGAEILQAEPCVFERCEELMKTNKLSFRKLPFVDYVANAANLQKVRLLDLGRVVCSDTDPSRSVAVGRGLQAAQVGVETEFTVTQEDAEGKLFYCEDDRVTATVRSSTGEHLQEKIEDSKDGKYRVTYTPESAGQHDVLVTINGEPLPGSPWSVQVTPYQYQTLFTFGSKGTGPGQFDGPVAIAVSQSTGNIAVADYFNCRIQMFSSKGRYLREFDRAGPGDDRLAWPVSVAVTSCGSVIVRHGAFAGFKTMSVLTENGQFIKHINQHLREPGIVSVGQDGHLIACDWGDNTIKILSPDGTELLRSFGVPDCDSCPSFAIHHQDKFFVSYFSGRSIKVFNTEGKFLYNITSEETGDGQFQDPCGLAVDKFNNLIVCDSGNTKLRMFTLDGKFLGKIEEQLTGIVAPGSVAVANDGHVFVTDRTKNCVHVLH